MSTNSSDTIIIATLNLISFHINQYLSIAILLFGTVGNLLNCLVLSQPVLRKNPCSWLFLTSSFSSLVTLISGVAVRLLAGWSADLTDTVPWLCKFRIFILFDSRTIASWLILLATIDRWLSSSIDVARRQISSLKNAQRGAILVIILSSLAYAQIFYCYEANLVNAPLKCYGKTIWCRLLIDSTFTSISILAPSLLMFVFGFLTVLNVRASAPRRIQPMSISIIAQGMNCTGQRQRWKKTDHHLLTMLFTQVILLTLFSLPQAFQNIYSNSTRNDTRTPMQNAINSFVFNLFLLLTYITNGMPFYIYTLADGTVFRQALSQVLRTIGRKALCK